MIDTKHLKVLAEIQTRANAKFNDRLFDVSEPDEGDKAIETVLGEALKKEMPEWKRKYLTIMKKELAEPKKIVNEDVGAEKDKWVEKEIKKAVKKGLLTNKI